MPAFLEQLRRWYGSHPLHLLTMAAGFALAGYIVFTFNPASLWNPHAWWQSIAVWLAAAIILHDLVLFPLYALADRLLGIAARRRPRPNRATVRVPPRNYLRIPALGSGLTLLMFWPDIMQQDAAAYSAATGHTQQLFLGRWLLLTAIMFSASAVGYAVRLVAAYRASDVDNRPCAPLTPTGRLTTASNSAVVQSISSRLWRDRRQRPGGGCTSCPTAVPRIGRQVPC